MSNKIFLMIIILNVLVSNLLPQTLFRSGLFLHHSVGGVVWFNGTLDVPQLMDMYNTENNYTGNNAVTMNLDEDFFPPVREFSDHYWDSWHAVFVGQSPYPEDVDSLQSYIANNPIIIIKTGWGGTGVSGMGSPEDTLIIEDYDTGRTYYRNKWHWRSIIRAMQSYPDNFFVIWTGIPSTPGPSFNGTLAHYFVTWAKDTLAAGNDPVFGDFPDNVYIFDTFHLLATATEEFPWGTAYWGMNPLYHDEGDNHPNETGCDIVAPLFVEETFDAAIYYEQYVFPVELSSFYASTTENSVVLNWTTKTEVNNYGFEIERNGEKIGFVQGNGNSNSPKYYSFEDNNLNAGKYAYRLKQIDTDGQFEYSKVIEVILGAPIKFKLNQNYPNPFNPSTKIQFAVPNKSNVNLSIYNVLGEMVTTLLNEEKKPGYYEYEFNTSSLASGVYIYRITAGDPSAGSGQSFIETKKMVLLR